jgi:hypothetical protein
MAGFRTGEIEARRSGARRVNRQFRSRPSSAA